MPYIFYFFFFFNDTATTEIYTLSLHDALPISNRSAAMPAQSPTLSPTLSAIVAALRGSSSGMPCSTLPTRSAPTSAALVKRSEEHTSELQSRSDLVCRLLLEKKKKTKHIIDVE